MFRFAKILSTKKRKLMENLLKLTNETVQDNLMPAKPNPRCEALQPELLALYGQALERYCAMALELKAHMETGAPLGADFDPVFG